jgi:mevalonate kinase
MLMGEHAVLFGHTAIASAVDKWIHVQLRARDDRLIKIDSALGTYESTIDQIAESSSLSFVVAAIQQVKPQLPSGFDLSIESEFSHTVGLGSSAAVTAATVAALNAFCKRDNTPSALFEDSLAVVHQVQNGRGSGTDLAASVYGGVIAYQVNPRRVERLAPELPLRLFYAGYKTKTPVVLERVEQESVGFESLLSPLYQLMHESSEAAKSAIAEADLSKLGRLMNLYQGLMDALGVNDAALSEMIYTLRQSEGTYGAKISGSGLGDCVITLGHPKPVWPHTQYEAIPICVSEEGTSTHVDEA